MSGLRIRCLGGFEVRHERGPITGFESQKVRALLAYLTCQRDRGFSREHLAGMLWPEKREDAARRNLRQAAYNLKTAFAQQGITTPPILAHQGRLQINPAFDFWLDVAALEQALGRGPVDASVDPHALAGAVRLYQGEFLGDFPLKESSHFEYWLLAERERLREAIVGALRALIESYLSRGEHRLGIQYARRLVALDPLSEEAHRYLMRLFAHAGRRSRALAQYNELQHLLEVELDVEPVAETRQLYETILTEEAPELPGAADSEPIGPLIPLVGRSGPYEQLKTEWQAVAAGQARLTLVEGEAGVGKTRLTRSFLDAASGQRPCIVLLGHCVEHMPAAYQPLAGMMCAALDEGERAERALAATAAEQLADLALLVPEVREHRPELPAAPPLGADDGRRRIFAAVAAFLESLMRGERGATDPLILHLDDLQWAAGETLELLGFLLERLAARPLWVLATRRVDHDGEHPALRDALAEGRVLRVPLERLPAASVDEIATWLVGADESPVLTALLGRYGEGLPLNIAETINYLWDVGALIAGDAGHWRLADADELSSLPPAQGLDAMIATRLQRLPSSTRRLAVLAAVIGQAFHPDLVRRAGDEHIAVVEVGLELMLERWMLRQLVDRWTSRRKRDIVLWAQGVRRSSFDFAHKSTRQAIYRVVGDVRRRLIHRQVAHALETAHRGDTAVVCEQLAFHYWSARDWELALSHLRQAAEKARALLADGTAEYYDARRTEALDRLIEAAADDQQAARWRQERLEIAGQTASSAP